MTLASGTLAACNDAWRNFSSTLDLFINSSEAFTLLKQFCADNPIADFYRFPILCQAFSILGPHNDKRRFKKFLRTSGIIATVAEMLSNPIKAPTA